MPSLESTGPGRPTSDPNVPPQEEEEEDDYMSMSFSEPVKQGHETSIQRRTRKQRDAESSSRPLSKAEKDAHDALKREATLATSLDTSNRGFQMMAKLGFKGGALGKNNESGRTEPIHLALKEDRGGIGLDSERKRKFREEVEAIEKKVKVEEGNYRDRIRMEREEKRLGDQIHGAMKVAERLDTEAEEDGRARANSDDLNKNLPDAAAATRTLATKNLKSLSDVPIFWRGLVRHRREVERQRRERHVVHSSILRLPDYTDPEEDLDDKIAMDEEEEELEQDDTELNEFNELGPEVRLARIVMYLRENHWYCFWCKSKYQDANLNGCPGKTENDHD